MEEPTDQLDTRARLALDVAIGTAGAVGDRHCGTEHLLFGLVATADHEMSELADLFALNTLRIERAIRVMHEARPDSVTAALDPVNGAPPLTPRAMRAVQTPRADRNGPTGPFEVLHGALDDESSGASRVLRELGVRPADVRRLAGYGIRHLSPEQLEGVISSLDRRTNDRHESWWGPGPDDELDTLAPTSSGALEIARSRSTIVSLRTVAAGSGGFGFTLCAESIEPWMLPPVLQPTELLMPGHGARSVLGPEMLRLELVFADGSSVDNRRPVSRWGVRPPGASLLVLLGDRTEVTTLNDRRRRQRHLVVTDWWVHPLPAEGSIQVHVEWPSESVSGLATFDARPLLEAAGRPFSG